MNETICEIMPKVSVVIPTYNCAKFVKDAVESALGQTYKDYEIVVVDDGSVDGTKEILTPYMAKNLINCVYQENKGHSCARNAGIKHARGEFIAFLDADDIWLPDKLELQMPVFEISPKIGLVHSDRYRFTDKGEFSPPYRENFSDDTVQFHSGDIFDALFCREIYISSSTVVIRRECIDNVGLFDENLTKSGFEDFDMWLRILKRYRAHYIHRPLSLFRDRPGSMSKNLAGMMKAHRYVIEKFSTQYKLPDNLTKRATLAMQKEFGLGRHAFPRHMKRIARIIKGKIMTNVKKNHPDKYAGIKRWIKEKYSVNF